eukprot:495844-Hanusia_phi.AAC.1
MEMEKWFKLRGEPFLRPHVKRVEFDVDHDEISSLLLIFHRLRIDTQSTWSEGSGKLICSSARKGECTWTICTSILKHPLIQKEFPVPFKENPYDLEPGSGSLYFEGPLKINIKRNHRFKNVRLCFKFEQMVRLCMFGTESWRYPPDSEIRHT